jgi:hypothetical protein
MAVVIGLSIASLSIAAPGRSLRSASRSTRGHDALLTEWRIPAWADDSLTPDPRSSPPKTVEWARLYLPRLQDAGSQSVGRRAPRTAARRSHRAAPSQDVPIDLQPVAEIPMGNLGAIALSGDRAYLGLGPRLAVLGLEDPAAPRLLGFSGDLGDDLRDLAPDPRAPDRVLVAAGDAGLAIIDASTEERPRELARLPGRALAVQSEGTRAYVLGDALRILDTSEAGSPREIGRIELPIEAFHVVGTLAWLAAGAAGVMVYDLGDPARPAPIGAVDTPGSAHDIRVAGTVAYVADGGRRLSVLDVSDPTAPRLTYELAVDLSGESACLPPVADCGLDARLLRLAGDRALLVLQRYGGAFAARSPARLVSIDLADPARPRELGHRTLSANPVAIAMGDGRVLAAMRPLWWYAGIAPCQLAPGGLGIYDAGLSPLGTFEAPAPPNAVQLHAGKVWLADSIRRLRAYSLDDPGGPRPTGATGSEYGSDYGSAEARDLVVEGQHGARLAIGGQTGGFVASGARHSAATGRGGGAADGAGVASNAEVPGSARAPLAPQNGCAPPPPNQWYTRIATDGAHDFLLDMNGDLQLFEPGAFGPVGSLLDLQAKGLAARKGRVYLATDQGLQVVNAATPAQPAREGSLALSGFADAAGAAGGADLVVLAGQNGLALVDARRPDAPRPLASVPTHGAARAVALAGHTAYTAAGDSLQVFDILHPELPGEVARANGLREARAVAVDATRVAVLAAGGLYLFAALPDDGSPPQLPTPPEPDGGALYLPALRLGP